MWSFSEACKVEVRQRIPFPHFHYPIFVSSSFAYRLVCAFFCLGRQWNQTFFLSLISSAKKESTFCTAHFSIRHKSFIFFFGGNFLYATFFTDFLTGKQNCHSLWSTFFHSLLTFLSNQTSKYFPIILEKWIPKGPGFLFRLHKLRETGGILVFPLL